MEYKRLDFTQYFIDTTNDYNKTGRARYQINYSDITYVYKGRLCHANYEIHYEEDRDVIQINFQKTDGLRDWFVNFMFIQKYYDAFDYKGKPIILRVHNGWARMYKVMKHAIRDRVKLLLIEHPRAEIEIIGWSLGSGQAMLCAQDLNYNLGIKSHLFTFGSVNPYKTNIFNRKRIKNYLREICKEQYHFSDVNDIVTYLPPRLFGFIKPIRTSLDKFNFIGLFNPGKYHCHYDNEKLYNKLVEVKVKNKKK